MKIEFANVDGRVAHMHLVPMTAEEVDLLERLQDAYMKGEGVFELRFDCGASDRALIRSAEGEGNEEDS